MLEMIIRATTLVSILASAKIGISATPEERFEPNIASARQNSYAIFNAVNNAMRQFGSSLHHNGMSFFQATIPAGTILHHGAGTKDVPKGLEWLAFEIEHAENFAYGRWTYAPGYDRTWLAQKTIQHPLVLDTHVSGDDRVSYYKNSFVSQNLGNFNNGPNDHPIFWIREPGYLHLYQAKRPLNVLYIDGMAAGKTNMGTNDAEDFIITGNKSRHGYEDFVRADDLCDWAKLWEIDGFIRMEPGFEVVYCNFRDDGLHQVSTTRRPGGLLTLKTIEYGAWQWIQAASQRYHGIGGGRVVVDYSSMVSAFFYPLNLTNPNVTMSEHPRLLSATEEELSEIRDHLQNMTPKRRQNQNGGIDWQGITDLIVTRYVDRLPLLTTMTSANALNTSLNHLLNTYVDYVNDVIDLEDAESRCASHYLSAVVPETSTDEFIFAGIEGTTKGICHTLFEARRMIFSASTSDSASLAGALSLIRGLMDRLRWSKWHECGPCKVDEVCFIAMWPFGNTEDHYQPSCQNASTTFGKDNYWRHAWA